MYYTYLNRTEQNQDLTIMRRAQTDLYDSFHIFQKKQENARLLLETNEILNYFQNKKYNVNFQIIVSVNPAPYVAIRPVLVT